MRKRDDEWGGRVAITWGGGTGGGGGGVRPKVWKGMWEEGEGGGTDTNN
jgi:hypothetical protein